MTRKSYTLRKSTKTSLHKRIPINHDECSLDVWPRDSVRADFAQGGIMRSLRAIGIAMAGVMASLDLAMAAALGTQVGRSRGAWKGFMVMAQLAVVAFRHLEIPPMQILFCSL